VFRRFFATELGTPVHPYRADPQPPVPVFALTVLAATLAGFALAEPLGVAPGYVAAAGALVLAARQLLRARDGRARLLCQLASSVNVPFLAFVFALGVVVLAVREHGLGQLVDALPAIGNGPLALLAMAFVAAALANLVNNLPATLVLVPLVAHRPGLVLAVLLGVNIGPNLTYVGSLATLLWRRILHAHDTRPQAAEFLQLGAATVPAGLVAGVLALWCGLRLAGMS
jgi:arsenical pump membrane protein